MPAAASSGRKLARLAAAALVGLAAALVLCEVALRAGAALTSRERGLVFDPDLGWRPRPGLVKRGEHWSARVPATTNAHGWRDAEHDYARTPGVRRAVVLGDSFAFGVGVDYGERFAEVLEREVERLEVVDLGVNGYGTDQELRLLEIEGLRYAPDVVLLVTFLGNDLQDIGYERRFGWPRPHYELEGGALAFAPARESWDVRLRTSSYVAEVLIDALGTSGAEVEAPAWAGRDTLPLYAALVRRMDALASQSGARLLAVLAYPSWRASKPYGPEERRVRRALESESIAVLDTHDAFVASSRAGRELYLPDGHWTPAGHALLAELLASALAERGWLR